jgi:hypothetical protein
VQALRAARVNGAAGSGCRVTDEDASSYGAIPLDEAASAAVDYLDGIGFGSIEAYEAVVTTRLLECETAAVLADK